MEEVNAEKFRKMLNTETIFSNLNLKADNKPISIRGLASSWITFSNCNFGSCDLEFLNLNQPELRVEFENCFFGGNIKITNCIVDQFTFLNTQALKSLNVEKGLTDNTKLEMNFFQFSNSSNIVAPEIETNFFFNKCRIDKFDFKNIKHKGGKFRFINNTIGILDSATPHITFNNSTISNSFFGHNTFKKHTFFYNCKFNSNKKYLESTGSPHKHTLFYKNVFAKVDFSLTDFINEFEFNECDFKSTTWFEKCENLLNSNLKFIACEFSGFSLFNKSNFNKLTIDRCTFLKSSSFTETEYNSIKLHEVKFEKGAYFEDVKINALEDKKKFKKITASDDAKSWRKTVRSIKQELQKTDNKIDYNRFRTYELSAYYRELKFLKNFGDKFILGLTILFTGYNYNWFRALLVTILIGMAFYSGLYYIEFYKITTPQNVNNFTSGAFRFFLVTDFFSPFLERKYLSNGYSWTIFVLGKIVIAFGIYEMIQAFRKFKA